MSVSTVVSSSPLPAKSTAGHTAPPAASSTAHAMAGYATELNSPGAASSTDGPPATRPAAAPRRRVLAAAAAGLSLALTGCGTLLTPQVTPLPTLSTAQQHRDHLARTEAATAWRAHEFAVKSAACQPCSQAATSVAEAAQSRLDAMGGLWSPWPADLPQSALVERPYPVAEAPTMPAEFVAWLTEGARHDLALVTNGTLNDTEKPTVAASAVSRLFAAQRLAAAYGLALPHLAAPTTPADAPPSATPSSHPAPAASEHTGHSAAEQNTSTERARSSEPATFTALERGSTLASAELYDDHVPQWATWDWDQQLLSPTDISSLADVKLGDFVEVTQAVSAWDCTAQLLPGIGVTTGNITQANSQANILLTRADDVLSAGATDARTLRCIDNSPTIEAAAQRVIRADFGLVMSTDPAISSWGVRLLTSDMHAWADYLTDSDLTGLIEPTLVESNN